MSHRSKTKDDRMRCTCGVVAKQKTIRSAQHHETWRHKMGNRWSPPRKT